MKFGYFRRDFGQGDELRQIREMIGNANQDPRTVDQVRDRLSVAARTMILMTETMGYMADSLDPLVLQPVPPPADLGGRELHRILNNDYMINNLQKRVRDLQKNIRGPQHPPPPQLTPLCPANAHASWLRPVRPQAASRSCRIWGR